MENQPPAEGSASFERVPFEKAPFEKVSFEKVYDELRALARRELGQGPLTLQPTALVHELYFRLSGQGRSSGQERPSGQGQQEFNSQSHFFAVAAKAMRQLLLNHLRDRQALKRGGGRDRVTLSGCEPLITRDEIDFLALHEALEKLESLDARQARLVELRFFSGLAMKEVAEVLGVSLTTAESEWRHARAWLQMTLEAP